MTRLFNATCEEDDVKVDGLSIKPTPTILTQGTALSSGILLLCGNKSFYVASNTTDIMEFLEWVSSSLGTIATAFTSISGSLTPPVPSLAAAVSEIQSIATALDALKENLK